MSGTQGATRHLDLVLSKIGHDGVTSLEGAMIAVALQRGLAAAAKGMIYYPVVAAVN